MGTAAKADHFENVKKVINDLIAVLGQEQLDEKDKRVPSREADSAMSGRPGSNLQIQVIPTC